jgi:predicted ATP-dependent endonuclease of OLD family
MTKLRVKNFGPIRQGITSKDGWLEFKRVTVFIGNQGSGKSTLAKLFSTFCWMEKALVRGDHDTKWFERMGRFKTQLLTYHRLEHYLHSEGLNLQLGFDDTELEYKGDAFTFRYHNGQLKISESSTEQGADKPVYHLPQVMYVPAERNFIAYVRKPQELKISSDALKEFLTEFDRAKSSLSGAVKLPINDVEIEYDKLNDLLNLKGHAHKLRLTDASSGFQSLVPLYLVSRYLANTVQSGIIDQQPMSSKELERFKRLVSQIFAQKTLTEEQQRAALSTLAASFNKTAFVNIVEEPEQNLFPSSQWEMLKSLLEFNTPGAYNRLVLTTHSPYIVSYLAGC